MKKSLSLIILSASILTACDEAKQTEVSSENGRMQGDQNLDFSDFTSAEKIKISEVRAMKLIDSLSGEYELNDRSYEEMLYLADKLECIPMGIMVGRVETHTSEEGSHGEWKMNSYFGLDEVVSQDRGVFEIKSDNQGKFFSEYGDSIMEAYINGDSKNFTIEGNWKDKESHGEIVGIKVVDERENLFGIWSSCD